MTKLANIFEEVKAEALAGYDVDMLTLGEQYNKVADALAKRGVVGLCEADCWNYVMAQYGVHHYAKYFVDESELNAKLDDLREWLKGQLPADVAELVASGAKMTPRFLRKNLGDSALRDEYLAKKKAIEEGFKAENAMEYAMVEAKNEAANQAIIDLYEDQHKAMVRKQAADNLGEVTLDEEIKAVIDSVEINKEVGGGSYYYAMVCGLSAHLGLGGGEHAILFNDVVNAKIDESVFDYMLELSGGQDQGWFGKK